MHAGILIEKKKTLDKRVKFLINFLLHYLLCQVTLVTNTCNENSNCFSHFSITAISAILKECTHNTCNCTKYRNSSWEELCEKHWYATPTVSESTRVSCLINIVYITQWISSSLLVSARKHGYVNDSEMKRTRSPSPRIKLFQTRDPCVIKLTLRIEISHVNINVSYGPTPATIMWKIFSTPSESWAMVCTNLNLFYTRMPAYS